MPYKPLNLGQLIALARGIFTPILLNPRGVVSATVLLLDSDQRSLIVCLYRGGT
jgi:hypothetical protein